jgi:hypothetical protein
VTVYASWNGATDVAGWRVLGGATPRTLTPVGNAKKNGFETAIHVHSEPRYLAVEAVDTRGRVLRETAAAQTPAHADVYGRRAFVSASSGRGTLPVACFTVKSTSCSLQATVSAGGQRLVVSPHQQFAAGRAGLLHFTLSSAGRRELRQAGARGLPADVRLSSASGGRADVRLILTSFSVSGHGPTRSVSQSANVQILGTTDFASSSGQGGILAACYAAAPCPIRATVSVAGTSIATSKLQTLGADEVGYLSFQLTPAGRTALNHAPGNQLAVQVRLRSGDGRASGELALVRYS